MTGYRRRPVPREWREDNHRLDVWSRYHAGGAIQGSRVFRAGGTCSCGERFGLSAGRHNLERADVIEEWKDHVEHEYYPTVDPEEVAS